MPSTKDLRRRIHSVRSTKKTTYAMKLVSAAKLRRMQEAVIRARGYTEELEGLMGVLLVGGVLSSGFRHPLMEERVEVRRRLVVVFGGSRGLCGGYNANIYRKVDEFVGRYGGGVEFFLFGKKVVEYVRRRGYKSFGVYEEVLEDPGRWPIGEMCRRIEEHFLGGGCDEVYLLYTKFRTALSMEVRVDRLLPFDGCSGVGGGDFLLGDVIYEPSWREVFFEVVSRVFVSRVRQASLEAKVSEHASRMTAMDSATKNADDLIRKLTLLYNKVRQQGITAELLDIIGGAEALK